MTNTNQNELVISHLTLRKAIGWLGMLLPFLLIIGNYIINQVDILNNDFFVNTSCSCTYTADGSYKTSISHYYYSTVGELFTGVLGSVALFMLCYNGHKLREGEKGLSDKALTSLAGIAALGVIVFPTAADDCISDTVRTFLSSQKTGYIHFGFAAVFFISLALMCMVNFRRTEDRVSFGKKPDHNFYLFCGIAILTCIALVPVYKFLIKGHFAWLDALHPIFILEALALFFFGISWLSKGQVDFYYVPKMLKLKR